jgi:hypothetical protein
MALTTDIETGLAYIIENDPAFAGVGVYPFHDRETAQDHHPSVVVHCETAPRETELPREMNAFNPQVKITLFWDDSDGDSAALEEALSCAIDNLENLQDTFNLADPEVPRPVEGVHVHYVQSFDTASENDGSIKIFTADLVLTIEQVID